MERRLPALPTEFAVFAAPLELWEAYHTGSSTECSYREAEKRTKKKLEGCRHKQKEEEEPTSLV